MNCKTHCPLHKKRVIEAICLDTHCSESTLCCFDCRVNHVDHPQSYILIDEFLETVDNTFNVAYMQKDFSHKCSQIRLLKDQLQRTLTKQLNNVLEKSKHMIKELNSSFDL